MFCVVGRMGVAVELQVGRFGLLLVALGRRPFRFPVCRFGFGDWQSGRACFLSLDGLLDRQRSGLALDAGVREVVADSIVNLIRVVALDVLPRVALLAVNRVSIIVSIATDTLDRVRLLLYLLLADSILGSGRDWEGE